MLLDNSLMSKAHRSKIISWTEKICRASRGYMAAYSVQYVRVNAARGVHIFQIRTPITQEWEVLEIPLKHYNSDCMPQEAQAKIDYFVKLRGLLEYGRDLCPMNGDLSPITPDERNIFGVRANEPNPCFPTYRRSNAYT